MNCVRRWEYALIFGLALLAGVVVAGRIEQPGYTDAYYYYNAAARLAAGDGLTDPYIALTYAGAPDALPAPCCLYWMPLTALAAAPGMWLGGVSFDAAQAGFVALWALLASIAFACGAWLGGTRRYAWLAGLLVICSGFFAPFWTTTDSFAPFGVAGALALIGMGQGRAKQDWRWFAFGGAMAGLAHLARADGLLLVLALMLAAVFPHRRAAVSLSGGLPHPLAPSPYHGEGEPEPPNRGFLPLSTSWRGGRGVRYLLAGLLAYLLVMAPWFARNLAVGAPLLPVGGAATMWLRGYDEITAYPPDDLTVQRFLDWGIGNIVNSRLDAALTNVQHFVAEQGLVIFAPFILVGLWRRRNDPRLGGVWLYAAGLHLAMTFAFAYPGMRGGLFHSSSALLPFWFSVGVLGLDDVIDWIATRRRRWDAAQAKVIFSAAFLLMAAALTVSLLGARLAAWNDAGRRYVDLGARLPGDAVVMVNDPAALYYHTGLAGVVVPDGDAAAVRAVAARYGVTHVVLDVNRPEPLTGLFLGRERVDFLEEAALLDGGDDDPANDLRVFEVKLP